MGKLIKDVYQIIRENWRLFFTIHLLFYLFIVIGFFFYNRESFISMVNQIRNGDGLLSYVYKYYYVERDVPFAILLTFSVNLFIATAATISLPTLLVPFIGLIPTFTRAFLWGKYFSIDSIIYKPLSIGVIVLEGEGYIIAAFAVTLYSMYLLRPEFYGFATRGKAFLAGIKSVGKLFILIIPILFVAAVYEVLITDGVIDFPRHHYPKGKIVLSGPEVKLMNTGCKVRYDSLSVNPNEAKVAGYLLEEIGYLKKGDQDVVKIDKQNNSFIVRIYLDEKYWSNEGVIKKFASMKRKFQEINGKQQIRVLAFCLNDNSIKKEKYL